MKKKAKKLKELSLLERREKQAREGQTFNPIHYWSVDFFWWYPPEGFVHRSVPTDEGAGGEEEGPEDGEAQADTSWGVHAEHGQGGDQVEEQRASADWTKNKIKRSQVE